VQLPASGSGEVKSQPVPEAILTVSTHNSRRETIKAAGTQTKKDTVELGLQASTKLKLQERSELLPQLL
jgi:hypothetical protein